MGDFASFVVVPLAIALVFRLPFNPKQWRDPPSRQLAMSWFMVVVNALLLAVLTWVIFRVTAVQVHKAGFDTVLPVTVSYVGKLPPSGLLLKLGIVYLALTAAIVEEYFFRFALRAGLRPFTQATLPFMLASAVTFSMVHWAVGLTSVIGAFLDGLLFAAVYAKTGDLRVPIVGHAFYWLRLLF